MVRILQFLIATAVFALSTVVLGWWAVPVMTVVLVFVRPSATALDLSLAAGLSWATILFWRASTGPLSVVVDRLALIFSVPGWVLELATVLVPSLLAWSTATLVALLPRFRSSGDVP